MKNVSPRPNNDWVFVELLGALNNARPHVSNHAAFKDKADAILAHIDALLDEIGGAA